MKEVGSPVKARDFYASRSASPQQEMESESFNLMCSGSLSGRSNI
jgi:hypothetical protein